MSKILLSIYLSVTFSPLPSPLVVNLEVHRAENRWPLNIKISTRCIKVDRDPVLDPWPSVRQTETITAGYLFKRRSEMDVSIVPSRFHAPFALLNPRPPHSISLRYSKKVDKLCVTRVTRKSCLWGCWKFRRGRGGMTCFVLFRSFRIFGKIFWIILFLIPVAINSLFIYVIMFLFK